MRISDWSSDVCSSDLRPLHRPGAVDALPRAGARRPGAGGRRAAGGSGGDELAHRQPAPDDGQLLPAHARAAGDPDGGRRVPVRPLCARIAGAFPRRSEEHTSELQSLMRISYAVFCLKKKKKTKDKTIRLETYNKKKAIYQHITREI